MRTVISLGVILAGLGSSGSAMSAEYSTTPPRSDKFVVEYIFNYTTRNYTPAVVVPALSEEQASYSTPEEAVISQFSAMRAGNYEWWLSGWTDDSRKMITDRNTELGRGPTFWPEAWEKAMAGSEIRLVERVETGPYVFVIYQMFNPQGELQVHSINVVKRVEDRWLATQELAEDVMFHQYMQGKDRVSINVR